MKQPMITIKNMTENRACCSFQGCLQTEKNGELPRTEHTHNYYLYYVVITW